MVVYSDSADQSDSESVSVYRSELVLMSFEVEVCLIISVWSIRKPLVRYSATALRVTFTVSVTVTVTSSKDTITRFALRSVRVCVC